MNYESFNSNIILGSAQFGMAYGISNKTGRASKVTVLDLLKLSQSLSILTIDTAPSYGCAENLLGDIAPSVFSFITKIGRKPLGYKWHQWICHSVDASLKKLRRERLNGLIIHNCDSLVREEVIEICKVLNDMRSKGLITSGGFSLNTIDDGFLVCDSALGEFQLAQVPCNILDVRFEKSGIVDALKSSDTQIHARSIFLQGLLLMDIKDLNPYFSKWKPNLLRLSNLAKINNVNKLDICVSYIKKKKYLDGVIVGVSKLNELVDIAESFNKYHPIDLYDLSCDDLNLIVPSNWAIK